MAQVFEDFSGQTVGNAPLNWSNDGDFDAAHTPFEIVSSPALTPVGDARALRYSDLGGGDVAASWWDAPGVIPESVPIEAVQRVQRNFTASPSTQFVTSLVFGRSPYTRKGYAVGYKRDTSELQISRYNATATSLAGWVIATAVNPDGRYVAGEWHWLRAVFDPSGSTPTLKARTWKDGDSEPIGVWHLEITDTENVTGDTRVGVINIYQFPDHFVDQIGVGTDGDPAPTEPVSTGTTVTANQAAATTTAPALSAAKTKAVGRAAATTTALPVTAATATTVLVGQATTTTSAPAVSTVKTRVVQQATTSTTALPATPVTESAVLTGQAQTTTTAPSVTAQKTKAADLALVSTTAQPVTAKRTHTANLALVVTTAQPATAIKVEGLVTGQAQTNTTAPSLTSSKAQQTGRAQASVTALPVTVTTLSGVWEIRGAAVPDWTARATAATNWTQR